jgi:hypothetical protein
MITQAQAKKIAASIDPEAIITQSNERGWFFINPADMYSISDPGFAVSKENGEVYKGIGAHLFMHGEE